MALQGKGFMIWKVNRCENGNATQIASVAQAAGLTHVLIKIANGMLPYNIDEKNNDLVIPVVQALRMKGIQAWGWHYVYGKNPVAEAQIAVRRVQQFALDGYVIDAEQEYKLPGMARNARLFMDELRKGIPTTPVALSSYRYPSLHPQLPWKEFLQQCDFNMPQVYWEKSHNPGEQLRRCVKEFQALQPVRPIIPTGPVYKGQGNWAATPAEITEFLNTARSLNLNAANFFEWYYGRTVLAPLWDTISKYSWPPYPVPKDLPQLYIDMLNSHDANLVANLYTSDAVHVTAARTIQGVNAIRDWFTTLFTKVLPNATFKLTSASSSVNAWQFTWDAASSTGVVLSGNDNFGLLDGNIAYHYSKYTITVS